MVSTEEIIEWFNAFSCAQFLVNRLGDEYNEPPFNVEEYHICNIKSSRDYMGEFVHSGFLVKEGRVVKSKKKRWFVLRTVGLYYYKNETDKTFKGHIPLKGAIVLENDNSPTRFQFTIRTQKRVWKIWATSQNEKGDWVCLIRNVIRAFG
jgi:hypothetical protein